MEKGDITGIVLAGGRSSRVGMDKPLLKIGGRYLFELVIENISRFVNSLIIVTNKDRFTLMRAEISSVKIVSDIYPGKGPLGGIYTGLWYSETAYNFITACDTPFLNIDLAKYLIGKSASFDAVVPRLGKMIQPLQGVYSKACLPSIESLLQQDKLQVIRLFELVNTLFVTEHKIDTFDPGHLSFFNINTHKDLIDAEALLKGIANKTYI